MYILYDVTQIVAASRAGILSNITETFDIVGNCCSFLLMHLFYVLFWRGQSDILKVVNGTRVHCDRRTVRKHKLIVSLTLGTVELKQGIYVTHLLYFFNSFRLPSFIFLVTPTAYSSVIIILHRHSITRTLSVLTTTTIATLAITPMSISLWKVPATETLAIWQL